VRGRSGAALDSFHPSRSVFGGGGGLQGENPFDKRRPFDHSVKFRFGGPSGLENEFFNAIISLGAVLFLQGKFSPKTPLAL